MATKDEDNTLKLDFSKLAPILKANQLSVLPSTQQLPQQLIVVFSRHRHYRHLVVELYRASITPAGKLKNPVQLVDPLDFVWKTERQDELKFYTGISRFKNNYNENRFESDLDALKAIVHNPLNLACYVHNEQISSNVNANSVSAIKIALLKPNLELSVDERIDNFAVSGVLHLANKTFAIENIELRFNYFIKVSNQFFLIDNPYFLSVIDFFKLHKNNLVIDQSEYEDFQTQILAVLEEKIKINYSYLRPASKKQWVEQGFDLDNERLIYLSKSEDYVLITPVMRYGGREIPVISQKQIHAKDKRGKRFTVARDEESELQFVAIVAKMHPFFEQQMTEFFEQRHADCFYMHRKHFLEPEWFLTAFEAWRSKGIAILGFNDLKKNKLSAHKAEIAISVISGIDWFETSVKVKFNKETVSLKHLHQSIRNKSKFVQLDDGTIGLLPDEWLAKFESFFAAGEVYGGVLRTPNVAYAAVEDLYDTTLLTDSAKQRLEFYRTKLNGFSQIEAVKVPDGLKAVLRDYQKAGLNWLNFLDTFNFGGCLADDMGLGKTIQILAFILLQKEKAAKHVNLVVVPASLMFNWQQEINKFAPSLTVKTLYGAERAKITADFERYDVVLTSYGTLLSDVKFLKDYHFNYIFLDESQLIKNTNSQRYKAVRLLQSRNKVVMTGTPIENNTYDLYGQLSFACPGLLGSKDQFKWHYAVPIDQFKEARKATELQKRINPFVLRRTKAQVAKELPAKTEMVIYCEMGKQQREIYESCRDEIRDYLNGTAEDELKKSSIHVLQGITKLRQICNSPALLADDRYFGAASSKMDVLLEQIESKAPYHKILVFSQFVRMLDLIKAELTQRQIQFSFLTGQTRDRASVVDAFQSDDNIRVFLISLKAGGVGLNLTQADYVYLVDPWWNPAVENQAIDRAHRIGQQLNVMAVRLVCPNTIEEKIMLLQVHKKDLASNLIKTEDSIFKSLTKKDLLALI